MTEFRNESGLEFVDISSESSRYYDFGERGIVTIEAPLKLNVSTNGGHRIFDENGKSHYIATGWIALSWVARDGQPNFVK